MKKGTRVYSKKMGRDGVVVELLRSGQVRVAFGSFLVECRAEELLPPRSDKEETKPARGKKSKGSSGTSRGGGMAHVDLHGMRVEEALDLVGNRINDALLSGASSIAIVHGIGTGKLKAAVHRYLGSVPTVQSFKLDPRNPGTTVAYF